MYILQHLHRIETIEQANTTPFTAPPAGEGEVPRAVCLHHTNNYFVEKHFVESGLDFDS